MRTSPPEERRALPLLGAASAESIAAAWVPPPLEGRPLSRAAIIFATAAATTAPLAACGKTTAEPDAAAPEPTYTAAAPPYGVALFDAAELEAPPPPPPDASATVITHPVAVPPYGVAPPHDAGAPRRAPPKR